MALLSTFPAAWLGRDWILSGVVPPTCPFRMITGRPCALCGLTRAFAEASAGHLDRAAALHPLWWLAASLLLVSGVMALWLGLRGRELSSRLRSALRRGSWVLIALLLVSSVLRAWAV